ncbi:MAG: DUF3311 domain-containing protein [Thermoplasmataceae archaeon]
MSLLTIIPFVALLDVPSYSKTMPELGGLPFFYWYQIMWLFIATLLFGSAALIWNKTEEGE